MSDTLGEKLSILAGQIVEAAANSDSLESKIDAFKVVSTYHVAYTRAKMKLPGDEDNEGVNFDDFRAAVNQAKASVGGDGRTGGGA